MKGLLTGTVVRRPIVMVCAATVVFLATFLVRFLSLAFLNDHFVHLSRARQILLGEVPVRDFFDSGSFLQYYASAAALTLSGGTLFGEAILTVSLIALGGALTFVLAATLSASLPVGLLAALAATSIGPRLYGYPKVFLYVLAMACAWRYAQRRSTARLLVVAIVTAMAFLFRHDHGVYIGLTMAGFITLLDWGERRRVLLTLTRYVSFTALLLLPFGIFIQSTTGVVAYLQSSAPHVTDVATPRFVWPRFAITASAPAGDVTRPAAQRETTGRLLSFTRAVFTRDNALAWLYYSSLLLPIVGALLLLTGWRRGQLPREDVAVAGALVLLCAVIEVTLVRGSPAVRLPDVAAPMAVLGAWMTGRWLTHGVAAVPAPRATGRFFAATAVWLVTIWSCASLGNAGLLQEATAVFLDPHTTITRLGATIRALRVRPIDAWAPPGSTGERALSRYIYRCTARTDRVLTANFFPEVNFYGERGFAGGQVYLLVGWHASTKDQQLTVARLARQRVPVMIVDEATQELTWRNFPLVADYVKQRYNVAATSAFGGNRVFVVYADRELSPTGAYEPLALPCYR